MSTIWRLGGMGRRCSDAFACRCWNHHSSVLEDLKDAWQRVCRTRFLSHFGVEFHTHMQDSSAKRRITVLFHPRTPFRVLQSAARSTVPAALRLVSGEFSGCKQRPFGRREFLEHCRYLDWDLPGLAGSAHSWWSNFWGAQYQELRCFFSGAWST